MQDEKVVAPPVGQVAEGEKFPFVGVEAINTNFLKVFQFDSPNQVITTETKEFSAVCPFSGLPDVAQLTIKYRPKAGRCIELKSLKYYLTSFRQVGMYQEGCTKRIYDDLKEILQLGEGDIEVVTVYNVRGGFETTSVEGYIK